MQNFQRIFSFLSIKNRKIITSQDGELITDFTSPVIQRKYNLKLSRNPIYVTKHLEGKLHLVSRIAYGSEDHTDLLAFFNGISNPFMISEGMVIFPYDLDSMRKNARMIDKREENLSKKELNKKLTKIDKDRVKALMNNKAADVETPNMTTKPPVTPVDGLIVLGTNVTETRCTKQLSPTQTMSEKIRAAVKQKILSTKSQPATASSVQQVKGVSSSESTK
jgi:hypothetical protein